VAPADEEDLFARFDADPADSIELGFDEGGSLDPRPPGRQFFVMGVLEEESEVGADRVRSPQISTSWTTGLFWVLGAWRDRCAPRSIGIRCRYWRRLVVRAMMRTNRLSWKTG